MFRKIICDVCITAHKETPAEFAVVHNRKVMSMLCKEHRNCKAWDGHLVSIEDWNDGTWREKYRNRNTKVRKRKNAAAKKTPVQT